MRYKVNQNGAFVAQIRLQPPDTLDHLVTIESTGLFGDTLITFASGGAGRVVGEVHQFSPEPMWAVTDSLTVVYGINNEYRIGFYDRNGSLARVFSRPFEPVPVTARDIRAFFTYLDRAWFCPHNSLNCTAGYTLPNFTLPTSPSIWGIVARYGCR